MGRYRERHTWLWCITRRMKLLWLETFAISMIGKQGMPLKLHPPIFGALKWNTNCPLHIKKKEKKRKTRCFSLLFSLPTLLSFWRRYKIFIYNNFYVIMFFKINYDYKDGKNFFLKVFILSHIF